VAPSGEPSLVEGLATRLQELGIRTTGLAECPAVRVRIAPSGQRVSVSITDAYDRVIQREVDGLPTAATLVESWILQEVDAGRALPPLDESPSANPAVAVTAMSANPSSLSWVGVGLATAIDSDGTSWLGVEAHGCLQLGIVCPGATLRAVHSTEITTSSASVDGWSFDGIATAEIPVRVGRWRLAPAVSLGPSLVRATQQDPMHPVLDETRTRALLRGGAMFFAGVPLSRWLLVWAAISADAVLFGGGDIAAPRGSGRVTIGLQLGGW